MNILNCLFLKIHFITKTYNFKKYLLHNTNNLFIMVKIERIYIYELYDCWI